MDTIGEGLAALAFWMFIAAIIVAGVRDTAKKREARHETLRRMIESGKPVDEALMQKLMVGEPKRRDRDLAIGGIVTFAVAVGLAVFALVLGEERPLMPLLGAAGLVGCVAAGLFGASGYSKRARREDDEPARRSPHAGKHGCRMPGTPRRRSRSSCASLAAATSARSRNSCGGGNRGCGI